MKTIPDLADAVMPATAAVTFRNRDPNGTDTHCLSSGITLICSDQQNTSLVVERNVTIEILNLLHTNKCIVIL